MQNNKKIKEAAYIAKGMHCASCEILIEKKLLEIDGVKSVDSNAGKGKVVIEYTGEKPSADYLSKLFAAEGYSFSDAPLSPLPAAAREKNSNFFSSIIIAAAIILGFLFLNNLGLSGLVNVGSGSSLPTFFTLGILAGLSSCAALVGGIILSMSKQWAQLYGENQSTVDKLEPHLMFTAGRLISYGLLGAVLGIIGSKLQISFKFTSILTIGVSIMMLFLALQMLGVKALRKFQFALPKSITRYIASESNFKGKYMPFIMGALTFFLPCGFTITAQGMALLSGNAAQGGLIMLFFALGTAPVLLIIGLSSVKLFSRPHIAMQFSRVAGFLVLFFALFNINSQLNVLGYSSLSDLASPKTSQNNAATKNQNEDGLPPIVNGKQVLKMNASSSGYSPKYLKVRAGIPVKWEITDTGTSGCTNAVISAGLFSGQIALTPGQTSVKEFTPTKAGKYKFSCWMGMVSGVLEVVDNSGSSLSTASAAGVNDISNGDIVPSGAKGCGCGSTN